MQPRDESIYPVCDNVGKSGLQLHVIQILQAHLEDYFAFIGRQVLVGSDQFIYYTRGDPGACVSPDIYVFDDETTPKRHVKSWKVWERGGKVPALALEVVSSDYRKDYRLEILARYQQLGVRELIRYDPEPTPGGPRQLLSHFVRDDAGHLTLRPSPHDRVRSACFDIWLVHQPDQSLRLATGPNGATPWRDESQRWRDENQRLRDELARLRGE
jgi:Uma2 family endonuclease